MLILRMYLIKDEGATQCEAADNAIGNIKMREFKRIGIDSVEMKFLEGEELAEFAKSRRVVRYPFFELVRGAAGEEQHLVAEKIGYFEYADFLKWLKLEIANSKKVPVVNIT